MRNYIKLSLTCYLSFLLCSCGIFKGNEIDPEPLQKINNKEVDMHIRWSQSIGRTANYKYYGRMTPAIHNGGLYLANLNGKIAKYDANNGKLIWTRQLVAGNISGGVCVTDDKIFLGSLRGDLYALNAENGDILWQKTVTGGIINSPVSYKQYVVVQSEDDKIHTFDVKDGKLIWHNSTAPAKLGIRGSSKPSIFVKNELLAACFSDGSIKLFELPTGKILWKFTVALSSGKNELQRIVGCLASPIIANDSIYAATYQGRITKFDLSGNILWSSKASTYQNLVEGLDAIYLVNDTSYIKAFSKRDGNLSWENKTLMHRELTSAAKFEDYLILGDKQGFLHVVSDKNGEVVGRFKLGGKILAPLVYSNDCLYVVANNKIYAIDISFISAKTSAAGK